MAVPNTRATFKEYCLRALGKPVIDVNVDPDQVEDRIDEALQFFAQYHYDGIERVYLKYQITSADITRARANDSGTTATDTIDNSVTATWYEQNNWIPVPDRVVSILNVFDFSDKGSMNLFDVRYQLRLNDLYDFSSTSVIQYDMTMKQLDFLNHILVGEIPIRHNQHQNRLYLDADWQQITANEFIIIECYAKLDPSSYTDIWDDIFLKKYAVQLVKRQWGSNLIKFNGVSMLGGVTLNGETIYQQAQEELNKLEEQIQLAYELPPMHIIG
jgi:hypothetical protein